MTATVWDFFAAAERDIALEDPDQEWLDPAKRIPGYDTGGNTLGIYVADGLLALSWRRPGMNADAIVAALMAA